MEQYNYVDLVLLLLTTDHVFLLFSVPFHCTDYAVVVDYNTTVFVLYSIVLHYAKVLILYPNDCVYIIAHLLLISYMI